MIGISIKSTIGLGDGIQFSSLPENYYRHTGHKLIDVSRPWFFDENPYLNKDPNAVPNKVIELWNFSPTQYDWPNPRNTSQQPGDWKPTPKKPFVYLSNAEIWASLLGVNVVLNRPRLYRFEDHPYEKREMILLQTLGKSHGQMPDHIVHHVISKYSSTKQLFHIGPGNTFGLQHIETTSFWELARLISKAKMFIGLDSGPSWVASCYPDVVNKVVRVKPNPPELLETWVPLEIGNIHSFWDSRERVVYNTTDDDIGFTYSYKRL